MLLLPSHSIPALALSKNVGGFTCTRLGIMGILRTLRTEGARRRRDCAVMAIIPVVMYTKTPWRNNCVQDRSADGEQRRGAYRREASHERYRNERDCLEQIKHMQHLGSILADVLRINLRVGISEVAGRSTSKVITNR